LLLPHVTKFIVKKSNSKYLKHCPIVTLQGEHLIFCNTCCLKAAWFCDYNLLLTSDKI
jgi:hypothetical protein